ncbi:MAG: stage II sporulation protein M [Vicinamibacteria bacterium]
MRYADLEALAVRYRQVLHDFALARSRFPRTRAAERLASLALEGNYVLQRGYETSRFGVGRFLTRTFPRAFRAVCPQIALAAAIFIASALLGLFVATVQPGMAFTFLGPEAVEGLSEGRLWTEALGIVVPPSVSSSAIATNNMSVAISSWAGGALAGLGALYVLLLNGLLLGAVVGITGHYALAGRLLDFVAAHGPLEITLILVTAGAGLSVGRALVEAGEAPRRESLPNAARSALSVLLGSLPWFVMLGLVEGFISPSTEVPAASKVLLGLTLESLFLFVAWNPFLPESLR